MFLRFSIWLACFALAGVVPAAAGSPHSACEEADLTDPQTFLTDDEAGVVTDVAHIDDRDRSHTYMVKTYSKKDPSGNEASEWCFRYEPENTDTQQISMFRWELARIWADPFGSKERRSVSHKRKLLNDPIKVTTRVQAFEKDEGTTHAWGVAPTTESAQKDDSSGPVLTRLAEDNIDPSLPRLLRENGLLNVPLTAFAFTHQDQKTPETHDGYSGPGFKIDVWSSATLAENKLLISTRVTAVGKALEGAVFSMPALQALNGTRVQPEPLVTYSNFLEQYHKHRIEAVKYQDEWRFTKAFDVSSSSARAFIISHPIMVRHGDIRDCFMAASFAPIGMSFPVEECQFLGSK
jgi:hypothetical protein